MRARAWTALLVLAVVLIGAPEMVGAQDDGSTNTTIPVPEGAVPIPEGAVPIGDNFSFTGATVISPDGTTREMDAYQAAVFVQSWLGQAFFATEEIAKDPPPGLEVHRVDIEGSWAGPVGRMTVYFAADGDTPYIAFPQNQDVVTDPNAPAPEPADWFTPVPRVIDAFNGDAELIDTTGTQQATSTTTEEAAADSDGQDDDGSPWIWVAAGAAVVAVVGGFLLLRTLRSG